MNKNTKLLFWHKLLYDVYFYGAIIVPFFVSKSYDIQTAISLAAIYMVVSILVELPTGIIGDRYGHKLSIVAGVFLTGLALAGFVVSSDILFDALGIILLAVGSALVSGSDVALLRNVSDNYERDNRTFDYLKSIMLLVSFGSAGFIVELVDFNYAVILSSIIAFISILPLFFMSKKSTNKGTDTYISFKDQVRDLPKSLKKVDGGIAIVLFGGMVAAVLFSVKEIVSSLSPVYELDITLVGIVAGLAMGARILGTYIEKKALVSSKILLVWFIATVTLSALVNYSLLVGVFFLLASSALAQMLFYKLKYQLSSEAPQVHVASLVSGLTLAGRLTSGGVIFLSGALVGLGYFHVTFVIVGIILATFGSFLLSKISAASLIE